MNSNLVIIFGFVIIIVAIRSHYRQRDQTSSSLGAADQMSLTRATETAHRLEQRVETLERLLDEDSPAMAELEAEIGRTIRLQTEALYGVDQYDVVLM